MNTLTKTLVLAFLPWLSISLHAGTLQRLKDESNLDGKVSLTATALHVEGTGSTDIDLSDVLEADFSDVPFQVQYVDLSNDTGKQLPSDWVTKAIGPADPGGSASYAAGTLTLTGDGCQLQVARPDHYFFAGMPWKGDGQWTAYINEGKGEAGIMLRDSLEEGSWMYGAGVPGYIHNGGNYKGLPADVPTWLRLTRCGQGLDTSTSTDGKVWIIASQDTSSPTQAWAGFMFNSRPNTGTGTGIINRITFTPCPPQPETMPPGILFKSGSFLSSLTHFYLSPSDGGITRDDKNVQVKPEQVAAILYHPVTLHELAAASGQQGLIMKNGDFLASDITLIQGGGTGGMAQMSSVELGLVNYYPDVIRACFINTVDPVPSDYEIRLTDGSILRVKSFTLTNDQITVQEVSGLVITFKTSEIAQFRAGQKRVLPLINLPWKSRTEANAKAETDATNPDVMLWSGPNQEQILAVPPGTSIEFPLRSKFRALAMRVALAPGIPAGTKVTLHVEMGGKEIANTPAFTAGDQPRSLWLTIPGPGAVTLSVSSTEQKARLMLIDPVAVRPD